MNNVSHIVAGFMPLLTMATLFLGRLVFNNGWVEKNWLTTAILQIIACLLPIIGAIIYGKLTKMRNIIPAQSVNFRKLKFAVLAGITVSFLAFFANYAVIALVGNVPEIESAVALPSQSIGVTLLIGAVIPALFEELLFRGAMASLLRQYGTAISIFVPALCFSLVHIDFQNIAGSFLVGILCGYLTYSFNSVVPAIIVHFICNSYYYLMDFLIANYSVFGLLPYFLVISLFLLLVFLYFSLGSLAKILTKDSIQRFERTKPASFVSTTLGSPGVVILILVCIMSAAYNI